MESEILAGFNELKERLNSNSFPADKIFPNLNGIISYFDNINEKKEKIEYYNRLLKCGEPENFTEVLNSDYGQLCKEYADVQKKSFYFSMIRDTLTDVLESDIENTKRYLATMKNQEYAVSASRIITLFQMCEAAILEPTLMDKVKRIFLRLLKRPSINSS